MMDGNEENYGTMKNTAAPYCFPEPIVFILDPKSCTSPPKVVLHLQSKCSKILTSSENHQHHICWCTGTYMPGKFKKTSNTGYVTRQPWAQPTMHAASTDQFCDYFLSLIIKR
jgi:hypothetical protein